jgi:hypothetical protein
MTKMRYILIGLFTLLAVTSCDKYLTVNPKTEMTQEVLYSTQSGFTDALTGVYIQMKGSSVYGQALSWTTIEQLVSNWDVTANSTEQKIGLYNFTDQNVQNTISSIFGAEYSVIAGINAILAQIEGKKGVFTTPGMYEMIKGECLALRAYCHLDVLRMFGPVPSVVTGNNILPYVTTISKVPNPQITFEAFKNELLKDLTEAEALLKDIDPINQYSLAALGSPGPSGSFNPSDKYMAYRFFRMNFLAVKGLQARAYLWFNDPAAAYAAAKSVIDAKNPDGSVKFRLGAATDMTAKDYSLSCEQIFALFDWNLFVRYNGLFANGTLKKGTAETTVKTQLYGNTGTDIREANLWELLTQSNQAKTYVFKKNKQDAATASLLTTDFKRLPMLRISEMYLIAVETAPLADAQLLWDAFRTSRNITKTTLSADPLQLQAVLMPEYRKEFFGEGQAFFTYKRLNAAKASVLWTPTAATINYVIPLPLGELVTTY